MSENADTQRAIGHLQASVEHLQNQVAILRKQVSGLVETIATAKGGWKTLISVASTSTAIGAAIAGILHRLWP